MQEQISNVYRQLQQCVLQIEDLAALQERNRIAQELHDSLGYALTALNIQLQTAVKLWQFNPTEAQMFLVKAQQLGSVAIQEVRQAVGGLRADRFQQQSLEMLLQVLIDEFYEISGISPTFSIHVQTEVPQIMAIGLYRIVQESLNNIFKHAAATAVEIRLRAIGDQLDLTIVDNGKGFSQAHNSSGFGLQSMRERVAALMGSLNVWSQPGAGCQIQIKLPLAEMDYPPSQDQADFSSQVLVETALFLHASGELSSATPASNYTTQAPIQAPIQVVKAVPVHFSPIAQPKQVLTPQAYRYLEQSLTELIGPIAITLMQQASSQTDGVDDLVTALMIHLPPSQQPLFQQKVTCLRQELVAHAPELPQTVVIHHVVEQTAQEVPLTDQFINQCEQALTEAVGPIAKFLVQDALTRHSAPSPTQFVESLAVLIPDPRVAACFEQQLLG